MGSRFRLVSRPAARESRRRYATPVLSERGAIIRWIWLGLGVRCPWLSGVVRVLRAVFNDGGELLSC